jgi:CRISPR-associated protein Cmr1
MKTITFECETITPMFLSGADGTKPELRPPSIKGALRFWWRAMNGHLSLTDLKNQESEIFGGTEKRSKFSIEIDNITSFSIKGDDLKRIANYDTNTRQYRQSGLAYFFYIFLNQQKERIGFNVKSSFDLRITFTDLKSIPKVLATFWLFVNLGSLGSRCRRGAGSLYIKAISEGEYLLNELKKNSNIEFFPPENSSFVDFYRINYTNISKVLEKPVCSDNFIKADEKYSTLTSNDIYISKNHFTTWNDALNDIGVKMRRVRETYEEENRKYKLNDIPLKAVFGLPIQLRDSPNFKGYYVDLENSQRRASPLYISIKRFPKNKYFWVLSYLDGKFTEEDGVVIRNSKNEIHADRYGEDFIWEIGADNFNDFVLIEKFLSKLSKVKI